MEKEEEKGREKRREKGKERKKRKGTTILGWGGGCVFSP
jgi:hypothetical protein